MTTCKHDWIEINRYSRWHRNASERIDFYCQKCLETKTIMFKEWVG